jgi:hypothetical protein
MKRRYVKALVVLVVAFAVAIPAFYYFSYGKNDGLQQSVSQGGGNPAPNPIWTPPLSYGTNPFETFLFGLIGFGLILLLVYGLLRVVRVRRNKHGSPSPHAPRGP